MEFCRRQFLALSSVGVAGVAGCTGGSSSGANSTGTTTTSEATASGPGDAASVGETVTTENGIAITVTDARLANNLETADGPLTPTEPGRRAALVRIEAQNTADTPRDLPTAEEIVAVTGGTQFPATVSPGAEDEHQRLESPVSGEFYQSIEQARPSVTAGGWTVFSVPTNTESARLSWSRSTFTGDGEVTYSAAWDLQFNPDALANIHIDRIDPPSTALHHHDVDVILELSNTGGTEGTFESAITSESLDEAVPVTATLAPGESTTVAVSVPYPNPSLLLNEEGAQEVTYGIDGQSFTVTFQSPTLDPGEGVSYPSGLYLEVSQIQQISEYVVEGAFGDPTTRRPEQGYQFIAFRFLVENRGDQTLGTVGPWNFNIVADQEYDASVELGRSGGDVSGDINGTVYSSPDSIPANSSHSGWVVLGVTQGIGSNPRIEYQNLSSDYPRLAPEWEL